MDDRYDFVHTSFLRDLCRERGLAVSGIAGDLKKRLRDADESRRQRNLPPYTVDLSRRQSLQQTTTPPALATQQNVQNLAATPSTPVHAARSPRFMSSPGLSRQRSSTQISQISHQGSPHDSPRWASPTGILASRGFSEAPTEKFDGLRHDASPSRSNAQGSPNDSPRSRFTRRTTDISPAARVAGSPYSNYDSGLYRRQQQQNDVSPSRKAPYQRTHTSHRGAAPLPPQSQTMARLRELEKILQANYLPRSNSRDGQRRAEDINVHHAWMLEQAKMQEADEIQRLNTDLESKKEAAKTQAKTDILSAEKIRKAKESEAEAMKISKNADAIKARDDQTKKAAVMKSADLQSIDEKYREQTQSLEQAHLAIIQKAKETRDEKIELAKKEYDSAVDQAGKAKASKLENIEKEHHIQGQLVQDKINRTVQEAKNAYQLAVQQVDQFRDDQIALAKEDEQRKIDEIVRLCNEELQKLDQETKDLVQEAKFNLKTEMTALDQQLEHDHSELVKEERTKKAIWGPAFAEVQVSQNPPPTSLPNSRYTLESFGCPTLLFSLGMNPK